MTNQYNGNEQNSILHRIRKRHHSVFSRLPSAFCRLLAAGFLSVALIGCTSIPKPDMSALKPAGPVTSVVATWEPAMSNGDNPMRGFGGRIYFYDQEKNRPIKVDGTVIVYIFDEDGRVPGDAKPNEGLVFDEKTLKKLYSKSKIGHSYSLWVPLDEAGAERPARKVSLIVRYIPKKGATQVSSQATVYLPGKNIEKFIVHQTDRQIQQVASSHPATEHSSASNAERLPAMQSVTIR